MIEGIEYEVLEGDKTLGDEQQCSIQMMYYRTVHLKHILLLTNATPMYLMLTLKNIIHTALPKLICSSKP